MNTLHSHPLKNCSTTRRREIAASVLAFALTVLVAPVLVRAAPVVVDTPARSVPLSAVRLLDGPFTTAVAANRTYMLALEPDRLLAPFLREAGLTARATSYGNWENTGLDGHTAGHYLGALANMVASGNDTADGLLNSRLDYMLSELEICQVANGDGYIGGVPGSKVFWAAVSQGNIASIGNKWVPWYNLHKTFCGLRDAYQVAGKIKAKDLLVRFGDWCIAITTPLTDAQMQQMLGWEFGGMNEVLADIYAITGDVKYLNVAKRFNHNELLTPLLAGTDSLTGKHANTQIPKALGFERIATLSADAPMDGAARFFWGRVTGYRSIAFGGNSVNEFFNNPSDFQGMLQAREGPETCNTHNMLRLTEQLFNKAPTANYADYYERALYNHLLSAINPTTPGFVYFTSIRPGHYRVYSQATQSFWCCVGTGMENPGRYGEFIYSQAQDGGAYVNLFIPSEAKISDTITIRQETGFPYEAHTKLTVRLIAASTFGLRIRHPAWAATSGFVIKINGVTFAQSSAPSSYVTIQRQWINGDVVDVDLPLRTTVERLPDGTNWVAIFNGPILLAAPRGNQDLLGLRADGSRFGHVAAGTLIALDQIPNLVATADQVPEHVVADTTAGAMHFRLRDLAQPATALGEELVPFYTIHDARYQMYWQLTSAASSSSSSSSSSGGSSSGSPSSSGGGGAPTFWFFGVLSLLASVQIWRRSGGANSPRNQQQTFSP